MSYTKKTLEELDVLDDFLMNAVTSHLEFREKFCKIVLSVLMQRKIKKMRIISQRMIPPLAPDFRGIRMDVEIEEFGEGEDAPVSVYDMEPNLHKEVDLPRHNRFYQAKIDGRYLKSGDKDFGRLPNLYILTITNYDPFGYDYMMYRIRNHCEEVAELEYNDGLEFVYFYAGGKKGGNQSIKAMLTYLRESREENAVDEATREVHRIVEQVKSLTEVRQEYMTFDDYIYYERRDAAQEATQEVLIECIQSFLERYGKIPLELEEKLKETSDIPLLKLWLNKAADVNSISEFVESIKE